MGPMWVTGDHKGCCPEQPLPVCQVLVCQADDPAWCVDCPENGDEGPTKRLKQFTLAQPEEFKALLRRLNAMFAGEPPGQRRSMAGELLAETISSVSVSDTISVEFLSHREWIARRIQMWMCTPEEAE